MGNLQLKAREGDFLETSDGLIFDVKGLLHPRDRVIAYLRYLPDRRGSREREGTVYRKVYDLTTRAKLLRAKWPIYLYKDPIFNREVQAVPVNKIARHYVPSKRFAELQHAIELDMQERLALDMAETLVKEAGIPPSKIGVSGSILVGLHTAKSDVDLVLYGSAVARKCLSKLQVLLNTRSQGFSPYEKGDLRKLYLQRGQRASLPFEVFVKHERSKVLQGKYRDTDYFLRCIKEEDESEESYGDTEYYPAGRATVRATISDDSDSIFTPSTYHLVNANVTGKHHAPNQIVSFRGRFCEQAHAGEKIYARGSLERVVGRQRRAHRLVIGENPRDCLMVV
jgi:predicted nucleotidyltransferase